MTNPRRLLTAALLLMAVVGVLLSVAVGFAQGGPSRLYVPFSEVVRQSSPPTATPTTPPVAGIWAPVSGPSGVALFAVSAAGANGFWAVGTRGTVLRSTDGGATWTPINAGTTADLYGVRFVSDQIGVIAGTGGTIRRTIDGGATWTTPAGSGGPDLGFIWFANATVGYLGGNGGTIRKTTDAGATWTPQVSGVGHDITGIHCIDASNCWATGSSDSGGAVLKTTNGGATWSRVGLNTTFTPLDAVWFTSAQNGVVGADQSGGQSFLWRTTDGGNSWTRVSTDIFGPTITGFVFISPTTGWASVEERIVLQTTNGGVSWTTVVQQLKTPGQNRWLHAIAGLPNGIVVAVGAVYPAGSFNPQDSIIMRRS